MLGLLDSMQMGIIGWKNLKLIVKQKLLLLVIQGIGNLEERSRGENIERLKKINSNYSFQVFGPAADNDYY